MKTSLEKFDEYLKTLIYCPVCDTPHEPEDCIANEENDYVVYCIQCGSTLE